MNMTDPQRAGFSVPRLELLTRRIQTDIDARYIPGATMLIARNGAIAYEKALGVQDPATGAPMTLDTIFRIYSMTKPIVSVGAMMLAEQGRLLLSDPISKYLPELCHLKVGVEREGADGKPRLDLEPARQEITVQDLLRHTSGFTYGIFGDSLVKAEYRKFGIGSPRASSDEFIRAGAVAAGAPAGKRLGIQPLDRRARRAAGTRVRPDARRIPRATHPQAARHA